MRASLILIAASVVSVAACGGDDTSNPDPIDAAVFDSELGAPDAELSSVMVVTCPNTPDVTISIPGSYVFAPADGTPNDGMYTIGVGDIARVENTSIHNARSGTPGNPDGQFTTPLGSTATCLQFTEAGTFPFFCQVHQFTGTLIVQ